tara:strand:- start:298 stop:576 length:279 start_codon:yes stop_codon:yes gene_type:complete
MSKSNQEKPKWFKGQWYEEGDTVTNSYTSEKVELSGPELSIYDFILGAEWTIQISPNQDDPLVDELKKVMKKSLDWFREENPSAHKTLFDNI